MNVTSLARQEGVKRQINEAIESGLWPDEYNQTVRMRCECGSPECNGFFGIQVADYEGVRKDSRRFVVIDGHEDPEVERVISRTAQYLIVEKIGRAGQIAERLDDRTGVGDDSAAS